MISRRAILGAAAVGSLVGISGFALTRPNASIRFIGRKASLIALLDTGRERVLCLLGTPDDSLAESVGGLTTVGTRRVDLVIADHGAMTLHSVRGYIPESARKLVVQTSLSDAPIAGNLNAVTGTTELLIGSDAMLQIQPAITTTTENQSPDFAVDIAFGETRLILASSDTASRLVSAGACDILAIPGRPESIAIERFSPQIWVNTEPDAEINVTQLQAHPTDPTIIRLQNNGFVLSQAQLSS